MSLFARSLSENRHTLALAAPIVAGFVGQMLMGWADTIMVGRVGVVPLAACAFAGTVLAVPMVFGFAVLSSVSVRASHAFGAGHNRISGEALRGGLLLGICMGIFIAGAIHAATPLLPLLGQGEEITNAARNFLIICGWSVVPVFVTTAAKNFCEALSRPWVPFWIVMGGVLLNIALNWVLIYGNLGFPAMGLEGAGIATAVARLLVAVVLIGYVLLAPGLSRSLPAAWFGPGLGTELRRLLGIGLPSGGLHLAEVSGFASGSLMMGWLGPGALAAHQIAITCAATTFMIPLGLSQAVSVRIGQARGASEEDRYLPIVVGAWGMTLTVMAVFAVVFVGAGNVVASWFVANTAVTALAAQLLLIAGLFQIFDGIQITSSGALRGFEDTRTPMLIGVVAYWLVALPISYLCAFKLGVGPTGIWFGFVAGLAVASGALVARLMPHVTRINSFREEPNSSIVR
ncbi:MAG TPA: MATE family efflux transporter [Terrimicrobiaceae bacterium]|nr:MATE family efflux transporter [Terrimicrobiaceae bacterium]